MPIKPENRALYPKNWKEISIRIRAEAGQKCEVCKAPNGKTVWRGTGRDTGTYMLEDGETFTVSGEYVGLSRGSEFDAARVTMIVLTVAHLNHDPTDNRRENLKAMCQRCHLTYDAKHHAVNARKTNRAKKAVGDLLDAIPGGK